MSTAVRFPAIGTTAHLVVTDPAALPAAESLLREFLAELDATCSRFRPDSDLSRLNNASGATLPVHPLLRAAVHSGLHAAESTDGLVNPLLGAHLITIGYDRTWSELTRPQPRPQQGPRPQPAPQGGYQTAPTVCPEPGPAWRRIVVDDAAGTVTLPVGTMLDLGATAKAWAADVAARQIAAEAGCGVLVNLGGDLAVAGPAPERGWGVRVTNDHADTERHADDQLVTIRSGGLATSSTTVRAWRRGDQLLHHILDPATGLPARRVWRYVSVAAASCLDANTVATAAVVLGERAPAWLARRDLAARLVAMDGTVTTVAGWPPTDAPVSAETAGRPADARVSAEAADRPADVLVPAETASSTADVDAALNRPSLEVAA
jgi:FAD:protein FMN transferase